MTDMANPLMSILFSIYFWLWTATNLVGRNETSGFMDGRFQLDGGVSYFFIPLSNV